MHGSQSLWRWSLKPFHTAHNMIRHHTIRHDNNIASPFRLQATFSSLSDIPISQRPISHEILQNYSNHCLIIGHTKYYSATSGWKLKRKFQLNLIALYRVILCRVWKVLGYIVFNFFYCIVSHRIGSCRVVPTCSVKGLHGEGIYIKGLSALMKLS